MKNNTAVVSGRNPPYSLIPFLCGAFLIALAVFLQYLPAVDFDFLGWDDTSYIQEDAVVSQGLNKDSLHYAFTKFDNPYFMPLTRLSYMADVSLFSLEKAHGFRLSNIFLHILNSLLLFFLVYQVAGRWLVAFITGLVFALHPQHVEAVVWIAGRKELLAGFFGLLSLLSYQQYSRTHHQAWLLVALLNYGGSLFCKPIWIALPGLLLLWDYFPLQKLRRETWLPCFIEKIPFFMVGLLFALLFTFSIQITDLPIGYFPDAPWSTRWMLPWIAMGKYLANTFFPVHLLPYYAFPDVINTGAGWFWASFLSVLLWVFWKYQSRYPGLLMASLWFAFALTPALKITVYPTGESIFIGDRYSYLSHIGLFIGLALTLDSWFKHRSKPWHIASGILSIALITSLAFMAQKTISPWGKTESLWLYTLEHTEGKGKAYVLGILGSYYEKQQRYQEAVLAYRQAHEIDTHPFIYPLLVGSLMGRFGEVTTSQEWFNKVLDESPAPAKILFDYGKNQYSRGNNTVAERFLAKAIERNNAAKTPYKPQEIYLLLGLAQLKNQHWAAAIDSLEHAHLPPQEKTNLCQQLIPSGQNDKNPPIDTDRLLTDYCQSYTP